MKSFRIFLAGVAVALLTVFTPMAAQAAPKEKTTVTSLISALPAELVVKQVATLTDGREVTIYYKKAGDFCEIYSDSNLKGYTESDLLKLNSTSFSISRGVKGECLYRCPVAKALKIFKSLVNTYL